MEVNYTSVTGRLDYVVEEQAWKFVLSHPVRYVGSNTIHYALYLQQTIPSCSDIVESGLFLLSDIK